MEEKVMNIVAQQLDLEADAIDLDAAFINDLGADSFELIELIEAFEVEFGIKISDADAEKIQTVRDAVEYIKKNVKA